MERSGSQWRDPAVCIAPGARLARILLVLVLLAVSPHGRAAEKEDGCRAGFGHLIAPFKHTGKALVYPAVAIGKTSHALGKALWNLSAAPLRELPRRLFREDKWHLGVYLGLLGLYRSTGVSYYQLEEETREFDEFEPDSLTVVIDAFPDDDPLYAGAGEFIWRHKYGKKSNVIFAKVKDEAELFERLREIASRHGKIRKLDYYGHGFPGILEMDGHLVAYPALTEKRSVVFGKDARVRFCSCFVGNGADGERFAKNWKTYVMPEGGKIYGSTVQVLPNVVEMTAFKLSLGKPPSWVRWLGEPLSGALGPWTAATLAQMHADASPKGAINGPLSGPTFGKKSVRFDLEPEEGFRDVPEGPGRESLWNIYDRRNTILYRMIPFPEQIKGDPEKSHRQRMELGWPGWTKPYLPGVKLPLMHLGGGLRPGHRRGYDWNAVDSSHVEGWRSLIKESEGLFVHVPERVRIDRAFWVSRLSIFERNGLVEMETAHKETLADLSRRLHDGTMSRERFEREKGQAEEVRRFFESELRAAVEMARKKLVGDKP